MLLTYKEAYKKYRNDYGINRAINNSEIYKVSRGIFSDKKYVDPIVLYSKKYSKGIISFDSAFYYYDLTDVVPDKTHMSIKKHSRKIEDPNVVVSYIDENKFEAGLETIEKDGVQINIYNKERLLVELIRRRNTIPFDYYKEIIRNYRKQGDMLDMNKIEKYIAMYSNSNSLSEAIIREVY